MRVTAVVPVFNRKELTLACIAQLLAQRLDGFTLRIVIVDDGCTDGTGEAIRAAFPEVEVLRTEGDRWWTGSVNIGIRRAKELGCDAIYLANDDIRFGPGCLAELVRCAERHGLRALVGSVVLNEQTGKLIMAGYRLGGLLMEPRLQFAGCSLEALNSEDIPADVLPGKSLLFPASLLDSIGPLDERHFPHGNGDIEFTLRATLRGYSCFACPRSTVTSDVNPNYLPLMIVHSTRLEFLRCMFHRRYGFSVGNMLAVALFMPRPPAIAALAFAAQSARLLKHALLKLLLPKTVLYRLYHSPAFDTQPSPKASGDSS